MGSPCAPVNLQDRRHPRLVSAQRLVAGSGSGTMPANRFAFGLRRIRGSAPSQTMRLLLILILAVWGSGALIATVYTQGKGRDANLTAAYLFSWPVLALVLYFNDPAPLWLVVPASLGLVPWLISGPHLWAVFKDPAASRPGRTIGIPNRFWLWGSLAAFAIGIVLE